MTEPRITIDMKKNRIRIHKSTLHILGDPDYITLIINPEKQAIGVAPGYAEDRTSHRIKPGVKISGDDCDLYSHTLIEGLNALCPEWRDLRTRRIPGKLIADENMCCFEMRNADAEDGENKS